MLARKARLSAPPLLEYPLDISGLFRLTGSIFLLKFKMFR
jgi:hypothetical protein